MATRFPESVDLREDDAPSAPSLPQTSPPTYVSATHAVLFEADAPACDACGTALAEEEDDGFSVQGRGLYVWARGDQVRYEEPPLCSSCAAAIGLSALARWEIEEEEG